MCNFGLEKNEMPHKIKQIILQGQEKKSPEENLLLSPVKKTEDIAATLKDLNRAVKSEALERKGIFHEGKLRLNTKMEGKKTIFCPLNWDMQRLQSKPVLANTLYSKANTFQFHTPPALGQRVQQGKHFKP